MANFWWEPSSWFIDSCLLAVSSHDRKTERERERLWESTQTLWCLFSCRHSFHHRGFTLVTSVKPNYFPKAPPSNTITLRFGEHSVHNRGTLKILLSLQEILSVSVAVNPLLWMSQLLSVSFINLSNWKSSSQLHYMFSSTNSNHVNSVKAY